MWKLTVQIGEWGLALTFPVPSVEMLKIVEHFMADPNVKAINLERVDGTPQPIITEGFISGGHNLGRAG